MDDVIVDWNKFLPGNIKNLSILRKGFTAEVEKISNVNVDYGIRHIFDSDGTDLSSNCPTILYRISLNQEQKANLWKMYDVSDGIRDTLRVVRAIIGVDYKDGSFASYKCTVEAIPDLLIGKYIGYINSSNFGDAKVTLSLKDTVYKNAKSVQDLTEKMDKKYKTDKKKQEQIIKKIEERRENARIAKEKIRIAKEKARIAEEMMLLRKSIICEVVDLVQEMKDIENVYDRYDLMDIDDD